MNFLLSVSRDQILGDAADFFKAIEDAFMTFSVFDAIDILLLSAIFFFLLRFLTHRKAGTLLLGILVCMVVLFVSNILGLHGTSLIFASLFDVGVLALIIIFQPELRNALEKIGSGSFGGFISLSERRKRNQVYMNSIDNICAAVEDLSKSKTGALIVFARTTHLDDIMASGVILNADVNSHLLRNIFFNKAPLHDGAVIIDESRIVAAGCLLPLTRRSDVDPNLGTRHRAAIGMSETSDALIIVVSEETGVISVAADCELTRDFTPETLKSFILKKTFIGRNVK